MFCVKIYLILCISFVVCSCKGPFHDHPVFVEPSVDSEYFGYSIVLTESSLFVGAPKARNRKDRKATGQVLKCDINHLQNASLTCNPIQTEQTINLYSFIYKTMRNYYTDDMWFGATLAQLDNDTIVICAPRYMVPYRDTHLMPHGLCYVKSEHHLSNILDPLKETNRQAYIIDGKRKEIGDYGTHLNFYATGQFGMSIKVTGHRNIIFGAPGLLQWTGGLVDYQYLSGNGIHLSKQPITNPYFVRELRTDDYFGYAVESGVFGPQKTLLYVVGAPRSNMTYGQVLIFKPANRESEALDIRASISGRQLGSYFGGSLCCTDLNGDGFTDLLVGAPNFFTKRGDLPFDQGAVFVYLSVNEDDGFSMNEVGHVTGSTVSGARFGYTIADVGDVDGDGFTDIAISAPWENGDKGAVYIYKGCRTGLKLQYIQRITSDNSLGFGMSISKGVDLDYNNCNDIAIGAYKSGTAYIYRGIPTITVHASIKVPDMMDLPVNATNFTALFCVNSAPNTLWPQASLDLKAKITVDLEQRRATLSGADIYSSEARPGLNHCEEQVVQVKPTADLSRPISLKFELELLETDLENFYPLSARLSEESVMHTSIDMQLTRGCGADLICRPLLVMSLDYLDPTPYVPGSGSRLGIVITILNKEEPAFGAKVLVTLPLPPLRVPKACTLKDFNMTCNVPAPLNEGEKVIWEIELQYSLNSIEETNLTVVADLEDQFYMRNISGAGVKEIVLHVSPQASFGVSGIALLNATMLVKRQKLSNPGYVNLIHYYEILNYGPSDWIHLQSEFHLPQEVTLLTPVHGCKMHSQKLICDWSAPAKVSLPISLTMQYNLSQFGYILKEKEKINVTTSLILPQFNITSSITSTLILEPATPIWPSVVGSLVGFLVLAAIIYGLKKYGFFSRQDREKLKELQKGPSSDKPGCSTAELEPNNDKKRMREFLLEDSD